MTRPLVSFVIPTLNAEKILPACLRSIRKQDLDASQYEILLADGGSADRTAAIAQEFGCRPVEAKGLLAEAAKKKCFEAAQSRYVALLDSDNEIASADWLRRALEALDAHPEALGFESYYLKHPADSHLNRFLTGCLQISDPIARSMATLPELVARDAAGVETWRLPDTGAYPTGANGFIFRKELLARLGEAPYHEAAFFPQLMRQGLRELVKIRGCGVYHHYVSGWRDYFRKRRRAMILYLLRKQETRDTWDQRRLSPRMKLRILWNLSFIGPLAQSVARAARERDPEWLLWAPASAVSAVGNIVGVLGYHLSPSQSSRQAAAMTLSKFNNRAA